LNTNSINANPVAAVFPKVNCKSTPEIKNNAEIVKLNKLKENCIDKENKKVNLLLDNENNKDTKDIVLNNLTSPGQQQSPKNGNQLKISQLNFWKKPIVQANNSSNINGVTGNAVNNLENENLKTLGKNIKGKNTPQINMISTMNSKEINLKKGLNLGKTGGNEAEINNVKNNWNIVNKISNLASSSNNNINNTHILSTNNTDKKENLQDIKNEEYNKIQYNTNKYLNAPKNLDNLKFHENNKILINKIDSGIQNSLNCNFNLTQVNNSKDEKEKSNTFNQVEDVQKMVNLHNKYVNFNNYKIPSSTSNNFITNYKTEINIGLTKENVQSEILSSIMNFKSLLKSNDVNELEKLLCSEENMKILNQLNSKLNEFGGITSSNGFNLVQKEKSLLNENNVIKRHTFIENSVNNKTKNSFFHPDNRRNVNVNMNEQFNNTDDNNDMKYQNMNINIINATMLSKQLSPKVAKTSMNILSKISDVNSNLKINENLKKEKIMNEIQLNGEMRMKKYEILLEFINSNLKEINKMVLSNFSNIPQQRKQEHFPLDQDLFIKEEDNNTEIFSSLHSRINLNSKTLLSNDKENLCDYEETQMLEKSNLIQPRYRVKEGSILINLDILKKEELKQDFKNLHEVCPSFFISSINSDYYQHLLEESQVLNNFQQFNNVNNFSIELSSTKPYNETVKRKDRMLSYDSDTTPLQYKNVLNDIVKVNVTNNNFIKKENAPSINYQGNPNLGNYFSDVSKNKINKISQNNKVEKTIIQNNYNNDKDSEVNKTENFDCSGGEENLEDSELDKTKENNGMFNYQ
jgi:hypothetical protein